MRDKEKMKEIPKRPGYYKWWAKEEDLELILDKLKCNNEEVRLCIEAKKFFGEVYYCIYIGIEKSLYARLKWHITQNNNEKNVRNGTLSTLRFSIVSLFDKDPTNNNSVNEFINKLVVEPFECDTYEQAQKIEREHLQGEFLYLLNIKDNKHPLAPYKILKAYRHKAKQTVL